MNKRYLSITQVAAEELIKARKLQSIDYDEARVFSSLLLAQNSVDSYLPTVVKVADRDDGVLLVGMHEKFEISKNTLTFDFDSASFSEVSDAERLMCLQKVIRFSIKYWRRLGLNSNEYTPPGSTKAVVFPFPIKTGSSYRVSIERDPDSKRVQKRFSGQHLLVYKFGKDEGEGVSESVSVNVFRKAISELSENRLYDEKVVTAGSQDRPIHVSDLNAPVSSGYVDPINFWDALTSPQEQFVKSSLLKPSRIQGSAGTGKTLCLILKSIYNLRSCKEAGKPVKVLFVTPSKAMTRNIKSVYDIYCPEGFHVHQDGAQTVNVCTLQEVCAKFVGHLIDEESFLDSDSQSSKETQLINLAVIFEELKEELSRHKNILSNEFYEFLRDESEISIAELFRHEISVVIKGRANFSIEDYLVAERPQYGLPIKNEADRYYSFKVYERYDEQLDSLNQFDVDDVVITAVSNLHTPIWRRRRQQEGYDCVFIDETHLFNMNELSVVHYLTKNSSSNAISYAVDKSQAIGDIAWSDSEVDTRVTCNSQQNTQLNAVFRSSYDIVKLSYSILSHGVGLFSNFDNPIDHSSFSYEGSGCKPVYVLAKDNNVVKKAVEEADSIRSDNGVSRNKISIGVFNRLMLEEMKEYMEGVNKPCKILKRRGDVESVREAEKTSSYILGLVEHMGGLEFEAVVLAGVDKGRVPLEEAVNTGSSRIYNNYVAHNKMYVGVSRARKFVSVVGEADRGVSPTLENAVSESLIEVEYK